MKLGWNAHTGWPGGKVIKWQVARMPDGRVSAWQGGWDAGSQESGVAWWQGNRFPDAKVPDAKVPGCQDARVAGWQGGKAAG